MGCHFEVRFEKTVASILGTLSLSLSFHVVSCHVESPTCSEMDVSG